MARLALVAGGRFAAGGLPLCAAGDGADAAESQERELGGLRPRLSLHRMGDVPAGPARSLADHLHRSARLPKGRIDLVGGSQSADGGPAQAALAAAAASRAILRDRSNSVLHAAVFLRVSIAAVADRPQLRRRGSRQRILSAGHAAQLPFLGTLFPQQSMAARSGALCLRTGTAEDAQRGSSLLRLLSASRCDFRRDQSLSRFPGPAGADRGYSKLALAEAHHHRAVGRTCGSTGCGGL